MEIAYCKRPCAECPWRTDVPLGKFPPTRFQTLARTAYDLARQIFACHMSHEGAEVTCAGYLMQQSAHNLTIRRTDQRFDDVASDAPLFATYREMAIANGVRPDDWSLRECRDDGQRG